MAAQQRRSDQIKMKSTMDIDPFETRDPQITADVSRTCFVLPMAFLTWISLWPTKLYSRRSAIAFWTIFLLMLLLEIGQLLYIVLDRPDITQLTIIMSTLSTTLQGLTKTTLVYVHSRRLRQILDQAFFMFWPSNLMGNAVKASLKRIALFVQFNMVTVTVSAAIFGIGFHFKPLLSDTRELPFLAWYPFDWRTPGVYEMIYALQVVTNFFLIVLCILGHDFIFLALATNVIAQFRLLGEVVDNLGSGNDRELDARLGALEGVRQASLLSRSAEQQLLAKVVAHHNKLLAICDELEQIFSPSLFVQLATSVVAICVSSFLLTAVAEIQVAMLFHLASYCLGHVLQLFIICAAGSEMAHQSERFSNNAYMCCWYQRKYANIRKGFILIILRAQRAVKVTALGFFEMNYATFIAVMRLSFSFYTLLTGIIEQTNL